MTEIAIKCSDGMYKYHRKTLRLKSLLKAARKRHVRLLRVFVEDMPGLLEWLEV